MLKLGLILQIMNQNAIPLMDHCLKEKIKKETGLKKDELGGKNEETYSYLIDYSSEDKKAKGTTKVFRKKKT